MPLLTPEQDESVSVLSALCSQVLTPSYLGECHHAGSFPYEAMTALAQGGWAGLAVDAEFGGSGASTTDLALAHQVIARHSLGVAQAYFSLWVLGAEYLARLGTRAQQEAWLPRLASGEAFVAFALTEPEAGSDAAAIRTKAVPVEGGWSLRGQKVFTTGAAVADMIIVAVRTEDTPAPQAGLTLMLLDPDQSGVSIRPMQKIGLKMLDLCEVYLDDAFVPDDGLLGDVNGAWANMAVGLARERLFLAALAAGSIRDVLESSVRYAQERHAFGKPIGSFQMIGQKLARMQVDTHLSEMLVLEVAQRIDRGEPAAVLAAEAKLFTTEAYISAAREGTQVHGGYGFVSEYAVARHYADCKYLEVGGGSSEMMVRIISRDMGLA